MKDLFEIANGTITGKLHTRRGQNNQDAFYAISDSEAIVALVCDGCGAEKNSEVGAKLGAHLLAESIRRHTEIFSHRQISLVKANAPYPFWERVLEDVLAQIRVLANAMGQSLSSVIYDYFLFTMVGALVTKAGTVVFSLGDGVAYANGEFRQFGPFPDNEPPYLGYGITGSSLTEKDPELLKVKIHWLIPTEQVNSILIGTDGVIDLIKAARQNLPGKEELVGSIDQFWQEDRYFTNSDMVRRRLSLVNRDYVKPLWKERKLYRESGLLPDDTTLIVVRRKQVNTESKQTHLRDSFGEYRKG